ncbi:TIGR03862 family flavoprotein [Tabrizicola sp. J26]|uniref:TIGR03862 family flavoprotein n=1 Tax=Alitabrizicola rongguiensis TaxID=2909234 RepID=UPI001F29E139|nr:TIGR03862 family flavoprotein [Tabrizicola rongguiensis]MCF1710582.1 TIGR03862 family flavoprotein [Tabrizicola rongguiensis]
MTETLDALVIGAGPAGLMAAEALASAGRSVVLAEAKPTPARKFLMAGKSGLNLTKVEPRDPFLGAYAEAAGWLRPMLDAFGPAEVQDWARSLGQEVFTGSTGRVFPVVMKASPLLRSWLGQLDGLGVDLRTRWRWTGFDGDALTFATPDGARSIAPQVTVLALGGASWARLGSDGIWVPWLRDKGVGLAGWQPANVGFRVVWSSQMARFFGQPVKGAALMAGGLRQRGEFVISAKGIEGGGLYPLSRALREGAALWVDLLPDLDSAALRERLNRQRKGETLPNRLRKLGLSPVAVALAMEFGRPLGGDPADWLKSLPLHLDGPRPLDEAISVAGGITAASLTPELELRSLPGVFVAGEMLDWEAPTGGYLLTACLATGLWAGRAAARHG